MKRLMKFFAFGSMFLCVGLAMFGLFATEFLRTSQPPTTSTATSLPIPTLNAIAPLTDTPRPTQAELEFVTIIPADTVSATPTQISENLSSTAIPVIPLPTLDSALDATWTAQAHTAGTAAAQYQDGWRATMTQWAVEYAARQGTVTAHAPR
jgi:hypothetical protein